MASRSILVPTNGKLSLFYYDSSIPLIFIHPFFFIQLSTDGHLKVAQLCLALCDPMDYVVYGILQARILEWVAIPFSRGSFQPRVRTQVFCIAGGFFTSWATREAGLLPNHSYSK